MGVIRPVYLVLLDSLKVTTGVSYVDLGLRNELSELVVTMSS